MHEFLTDVGLEQIYWKNLLKKIHTCAQQPNKKSAEQKFGNIGLHQILNEQL